MVRAGQLDQRFEVQKFDGVKDDFGGTNRHDDSNWTTENTVWGKRESRTAQADESFSTGSQSEEIRRESKIILRYYPNLQEQGPRDYRLVDQDERIYDIQSVDNRDGQNRLMDIEAIEQL